MTHGFPRSSAGTRNIHANLSPLLTSASRYLPADVSAMCGAQFVNGAATGEANAISSIVRTLENGFRDGSGSFGEGDITLYLIV